MKKGLFKDNFIVTPLADSIEFGIWDEPNVEKWALFNGDTIFLYVIDYEYQVVNVDDSDLPEDYDIPGKYFYDPTTGVFTLNPDWQPAPPTVEEQLQIHDEAIASLYHSSEVATITFVLMAENGMVDDVTASEHAEVFDTWRSEGVSYKVGNIRRYGDYLYRCLTDHVSQASWTPDVSPSLWVRISDPAEEYPLWSQPIGAADAYMKNDKVTHNSKHWISDYDSNVWEPGVYGWTEVID